MTSRSCSQCTAMLDSAESLSVHMMHYHGDNVNRWVTPTTNNGNGHLSGGIISTGIGGGGGGGGNKSSAVSTASNSPTDSENNNQPKQQQQQQQQSSAKNCSPLETVSAAADSSDNQRSTPQPTVTNPHNIGIISGTESRTPFPYTFTPNDVYSPHELPYPPYANSQYEPFYQVNPSMDYSSYSAAAAASQQHEYKSVPLTRYTPYVLPTHSSALTNNSLSPRIVSSSSPTQNNLMHHHHHQQQQQQQQHQHQSQHQLNHHHLNHHSSTNNQIAPPGQPTPSPSPKHCDKCVFVCDTNSQLHDHNITAHGSNSVSGGHQVDINHTEMSVFSSGYGSQGNYVKEEPGCDILDLDSQKMVYPPHHEGNHSSQTGPLPSLHTLQAIQRPPSMWPPHDMHFHPSLPQHHELKPMFPSGGIKSEYGNNSTGPLTKNFSPPSSSIIKSDYGILSQQQQQQQQQQQLQQQTQEQKSFSSGEVTGNQVTTSPSEFPSTTTPQENGSSSQFRTFEAATSSLPANNPTAKATSWKSNEARRPKTYNCTACNKWFTSSGHLKRHYNTTLHKNAVKSSGQPDPATLPISAHHHPSRDPNKNHHHRGSPAQIPQPPSVPSSDQNRSPDYSPQYTPPLGFQQAPPSAQQVGFQQYGTTLNSHQTTSNTASTSQQQQQQQQQHHQQQQQQQQQQHHQQQQQIQLHHQQMHSLNNGGSPNGQAGPSVQASQPRGLLIYTTTNTGTHQVLQHQEQINFTHQLPLQQQPLQSNITTITNLPVEYQPNLHIPTMHTITHPQSYLDIPPQEVAQPICHNIIGDGNNDYNDEINEYSLTMLQNASIENERRTIINDQPMLIISNDTNEPAEEFITLRRITGGMAEMNSSELRGRSASISPSGPIPSITDILSRSNSQNQEKLPPLHFHLNEMHRQNSNEPILAPLISPTLSTSSTIDSLSHGSMSSMSQGSSYSPQGPSTTPPQQQSSSFLQQGPSSSPQGSSSYLQQGPSSSPQGSSSYLQQGPSSSPQGSSSYLQQGPSSSPQGSSSYLQQGPSTSPQSSSSPPGPSSSGSGSSRSGTKSFIIGRKTTTTTTTTKAGNQKKASSSKALAKVRKTRPKAAPSSRDKNGNELYKCDICNKVFSKSCYFTQHAESHIIKPRKCSVCGKQFKSQSDLDAHFPRHSGDKPHKCECCPKTFNYKTDLRRHMHHHSGFKPFGCCNCGKGFVRKDHMVKHMDTHFRKAAKLKLAAKLQNNKNSTNNKNRKTK